MSLYMLIFVLCSLCLCTVNGQDATQSVTGPAFLVTDGTRKLTLTCPATTVSGNQYAWFTPGSESDRCETGPSENVCTFTPRLEDDNQNVTCEVKSPSGDVVSRAFYQVNLKYPPPSSPNIIIERTPPKEGDNITCTVSGGKPRVTSVTFHCQHPDHADREDDVSDDGRTVSSSITVNTSQAMEDDMNCTCFAYWELEPRLYNRTKTTKLNEKSTQSVGKDSVSTGAIVGTVLAVLFVLAIVIFVIVCRKQLISAAKKTPCSNPTPNADASRPPYPQRSGEGKGDVQQSTDFREPALNKKTNQPTPNVPQQHAPPDCTPPTYPTNPEQPSGAANCIGTIVIWENERVGDKSREHWTVGTVNVK